jgi:hypothetical protein
VKILPKNFERSLLRTLQVLNQSLSVSLESSSDESESLVSIESESSLSSLGSLLLGSLPLPSSECRGRLGFPAKVVLCVEQVERCGSTCFDGPAPSSGPVVS